MLTLEDGFLARTYADNLTDYFKKIYLNRFGFEIDVEYKYASKTEKADYEKENAHKLNLRVKQIEEQLQAAAQNGDGESKQLVMPIKTKRRQNRKLRQQHFLTKEAQQERILQDTESQLIRMCYMERVF